MFVGIRHVSRSWLVGDVAEPKLPWQVADGSWQVIDGCGRTNIAVACGLYQGRSFMCKIRKKNSVALGKSISYVCKILCIVDLLRLLCTYLALALCRFSSL